MSSEDLYVLNATRRVVAKAREVQPEYAGPSAPARTDQISLLLARSGCHVEVFHFASDTVAMTLPPCAGVYPVLVNRGAERSDRAFALRHEVGHVLAGDVEGAIFLSSGEGHMTPEERIADLFALADLVPGWWIEWVCGGENDPDSLGGEIAQAIAEYAEGWPEDRTVDRARLRLLLYQQHAL